MPPPNGTVVGSGDRRHLTPALIEKAEAYLEQNAKKKLNRTIVGKQGAVTIKVPKPPTFTDFCLYMGVDGKTVQSWAAADERFYMAVLRVVQSGEVQLVDSGLVGDYDPGMAKFVLAVDFNKREKSVIELHSGGSLVSQDKLEELPDEKLREIALLEENV